MTSRRLFLKQSAAAGGLSLAPALADHHKKVKPLFEISLAEWSLHKALFGKKMTNLDFPGVSKEKFGITAVEYVNQFFKDKAEDKTYLQELKNRCDDLGVKSLLIMCDGEGQLGDADEAVALAAVRQVVQHEHRTLYRHLALHAAQRRRRRGSRYRGQHTVRRWRGDGAARERRRAG